jgi:hypothetical protein
MLKQYEGTGWRHMTIDELRDTFDLNKTKDNYLKVDMYLKINDFKKRVLNPALEELNQIGFSVVAKEIKEARKITAYRFTWEDNQLFKTAYIEPIQAKTEYGTRLQERLTKYGLSVAQVNYICRLIPMKIIEKQDLNQFLYGLDQKILAKNIQQSNVSGYVYTSLKNRWKLDF